MELWLWVAIIILSITLLIVWIKLCLIRHSAKEIEDAFAERLETGSNALIDVSSNDKRMRSLADTINKQLRVLRKERHEHLQGNSELKEVVTNISHDLRTPLTSIRGYLDLLKQEDTSCTVHSYLDIIENRTEALRQLTEELFRYSVITTKSEPVTEQVSLNAILEESIAAAYASLKERNITPTISITETPVIRSTNKNALSRILGNIISNAIQHSDGDLSITLLETGEFIFTNHAKSLDKTQVGKLFDRFYTVENAAQSTGIGLAIAKSLTEQVNGKISASYQEGSLSIQLFI